MLGHCIEMYIGDTDAYIGKPTVKKLKYVTKLWQLILYLSSFNIYIENEYNSSYKTFLFKRYHGLLRSREKVCIKCSLNEWIMHLSMRKVLLKHLHLFVSYKSHQRYSEISVTLYVLHEHSKIYSNTYP